MIFPAEAVELLPRETILYIICEYTSLAATQWLGVALKFEYPKGSLFYISYSQKFSCETKIIHEIFLSKLLCDPYLEFFFFF